MLQIIWLLNGDNAFSGQSRVECIFASIMTSYIRIGTNTSQILRVLKESHDILAYLLSFLRVTTFEIWKREKLRISSSSSTLPRYLSDNER
eukprot:3200904-Ditylum_brightwellii.AAC.1